MFRYLNFFFKKIHLSAVRFAIEIFFTPHFSRDNINESHDIDILIDSDNNTIGNEFFVDIQKMVKTNDDKDKKDTLSFSLSGIKFTKVE